MKLTLTNYQVLLTVFCLLWLSNSIEANEKKSFPEFDETLVVERLKSMSNEVVKPKYTTAVKGYIKGYTIRNRSKAEAILGRSIVYFPIFEEYLAKHDLPDDLKYLSVVESALAAKATSRVGAGGLWQFMPETAKQYGLKINNYVDERSDPIKATEAAMLHLAKLYRRFNDWPLALAAYNSGSGRVRRAIRRSGRRNFWRLQRYLPRETRNYVPAYIGACYLMNYYEEHNLVPKYPVLDMQLTETIKVYSNYSFYQIAQVTDLPLDIIEDLNPAYEQGFIPASQNGHYLTLPKRVMQAFVDYMQNQIPDQNYDPNQFMNSAPVYITRSPEESDANYIQSTYVVGEGETLIDISNAIQCRLHQLRAWNNMTSDEVVPGQTLIVYLPKEVLRYQPREKMEPVQPVSFLLLKELVYEPQFMVNDKALFRNDRYIYYIVPKRTRLGNLIKKFPTLMLNDLVELNGMKARQPIKSGTRIILKKRW